MKLISEVGDSKIMMKKLTLLLARKMRKRNKFIMMASFDSSRSKWNNWRSVSVLVALETLCYPLRIPKSEKSLGTRSVKQAPLE